MCNCKWVFVPATFSSPTCPDGFLIVCGRSGTKRMREREVEEEKCILLSNIYSENFIQPAGHWKLNQDLTISDPSGFVFVLY